MDQTKRIGLLAALLFAAVAAACSSTVETNNGGSGGCPDTAHCAPSCPASGLPPDGSACSVDGQVCGELDACGYGDEAVCTGGIWVITYYDPGPCGCGVDCPPPPEPCPDTPPANGSACSNQGAECFYADPACLDAGTDAMCSGGVWSVTYNGPDCIGICPSTLPVAGTSCDACCAASNCSYLDANGCVAHLACENGVWTINAEMCTPPSACSPLSMTECFNANGCRWIAYPWCQPTPGNFPQGCYPVTDCASNADCMSGGTCEMVEVDPCPGGDCGQCSVDASICVP